MITIPNLNRREKILLGVLFLFLLLGLYNKYIYRNLSHNIGNLKKEYRDLRHELDKTEFQFIDIKSEQARLSAESTRFKNLEDSLKTREDKLYSKAQLGAFLRKITQSGDAKNLDFFSITPKKTQEKELYMRFPVEIKLSSPYSDFLSYLKEIENMLEVLKIDKIEIELDEKVSANPSVVMKLGSILSDRPVLPEDQKMISISSGSQLFGQQEAPKIKTETKLEGVKLNGVIWQGGKATAIINNNVVQLGESIGKRKILEINADNVVLGEGDLRYTLTIE
ncbi:MAG: hypothetical protein COV72_08340 [Candidatus Omnitrophica bacterium CG11_big_fil_rev_8_21_14_0_20_42_13]|uniref:Pilus assembly protein PilO n=1 Tax=Candidatus Ghiorseimicrobium undicola TaxID=1974746 RepID=A0A2H0LXU4_9BACT|nr:MAG: hypothetical protein COV72_08340 [Candidatus Omnitrophica bacterium CG11_big_fil_rev_8_21_14_0_20_42_13]